MTRVLNILFRPADEWTVVGGEFTTIGTVLRTYVLPLVLVPTLARALGHALWGIPAIFGGKINVGFETALKSAGVYFGLTLVGIYLLALVVDALAPTFEGKRNRTQAYKLAAYASTAAMLAGAFALVPGGQWLRLTGLYSLYLLYAGVRPVMKTPPERTVGYAVICGVVGIVLFLVIDATTSAFLPGR